MKRTRYLLTATAILTLLLGTARLAGATLYAVSGASDTPSTLYELDPADGSVIATVGATGVSHVTGIACHPQTGVMYGVRNDPDELVTIDRLTGAATVVGAIGQQIPDISFRSTGTLYAWSESSDDLITVDLGSGAPTAVGECGCSTAATGLAFDASDDLFMSTGTELNSMNVASGTIASSTPLDDAIHNMLAFDETDVLYSGRRTGGGFTLKTIDTASGTVTTVGSNVLTNISAIAFCGQPLRHFSSYKAKTSKSGTKFVPVAGVSLADQFGSMLMTVAKPAGLGNPTNKNGEDPSAPAHTNHLETYQIKLAPGSPKFARVNNLKVVNQFGTLFVDALKPDRLMVPAAKSLLGPVAPLGSIIDHFTCYKVKVTKGTPKFGAILGVSLIDQFGSRLVDVKKPTRLCNPVNKNGEDPTAPSHLAHLMCYQTKPVSGAPKFAKVTGIHVNHQFGPAILDAIKPDELCIPSNKNPVCGNGVHEILAGEQCDDGNLVAGDGCNSSCTSEVCGDGIIQSGIGEQCEPSDDSACPGSCQNCGCEGSLRLVGGGNPMEGRLEVTHAGAWGTVCDDGFDNTDATVACQQLGFTSGVAQCCSSFGEGIGSIWMDDLACTGSESRLIDCPFSGFGVHNCVHFEDVSVVCTP